MAEHKHAVGIINGVPPNSVARQIVNCCRNWVKPTVRGIAVLFDICFVFVECHIEGACTIACNARDFTVVLTPITSSEGAKERVVGHIEPCYTTVVGINPDMKHTVTFCHGDWVSVWHAVRSGFIVVPRSAIPVGNRSISELTKSIEFTAADHQVSTVGPEFVHLLSCVVRQARSRCPS